MDEQTIQQLLDINRQFYQTFGKDFSITRRRIQSGVKRILSTIGTEDSILDLGCGNGELARQLVRRGHRATYIGLDFSLPLLEEAQLAHAEDFHFFQTDLSTWGKQWTGTEGEGIFLHPSSFAVVVAFAVLHHIPGNEMRLAILDKVHSLLLPGGRYIHSEWQFLASPRLRARVQPWERVNLSAADVDEGDHLLDWRRGGEGLRYVHQFSEQELSNLATESGFYITETFYSDGAGGRLGLYQTWKAN